MFRVVLDTNVLVSSILFGGEGEDILTAWKSEKCVPLFSRATFAEFRTVLSYTKFSLTKEEIDSIVVEEVLPFCEVVETVEEISAVCRDPADDMFLACSVAANADCIVSGDNDLLALGAFRNIPILSVSEFKKKLTAELK